MIEVTELEIEKLHLEKDKPKIYFCYTPLCGTCKLAKQMLEDWNKKNSNTTIYTVNLNFNPTIAINWKIKSVPYVAIFMNGIKVHEFYAFHSKENLERQLAPFINI